jgi:hypothetical protein
MGDPVGAGLALNLALLVFYYVPEPKQLISDEDYFQLCETLAAGGQPAFNPLRPPLYGNLIAAIFTAFGTILLPVQLVQIGCWLVTGLLIWKLAARTSDSGRGLGGAGRCMLSPELSAFSHYLWPETLHLFLWTIALWLLIRFADAAWAYAAAGLLLGLALLTKSLLLPFMPVLIAFVALRPGFRQAVSSRLLGAGVLVAMIVVTHLPTVISTAGIQRLSIFTESSVFNLWVGLNDRSSFDSSSNEIVGHEIRAYLDYPIPATRSEHYTSMIREKLATQGMLGTVRAQLGRQYFRLFDIRTFFTTQLPGGGRESYPADPTGWFERFGPIPTFRTGSCWWAARLGRCCCGWAVDGWRYSGCLSPTTLACTSRHTLSRATCCSSYPC